MTIQLPEELERFVQDQVQSGRFASPEEAIIESLSLLRQNEQQASSRKKPLTPDEVERQMLEDGLLSHIPARPDPATYQEFTPIVIEGEPLSETIIRERR
jgi:putative addiction module CopG family antidote